MKIIESIKYAVGVLLLCASFPSVAKTYKIAVISDMNGSYGSKNYSRAVDAAIENIRASGYHAVLSTGDMVAGQKSGLDYAGMWQAFHSHVTRPLDNVGLALLPSAGNHDAGQGREEERQHYSATFAGFPIDRFNPTRPADEKIVFAPGVAQNYPFYYAVIMGPALLIALDATAPGGLGSNQLGWLEDVLRRHASTPLKVIFGHMPLLPFTFQRAHEYLAASNTTFATRFEDLLARYGVQLFLNGHHHAYFQGYRKIQTRYVSVPLLGSGARQLLTTDRSHSARSQEGFLELTFDDAGRFQVRALASPSMQEIPLNSLPSAISIPATESSDCRGCRNFPAQLFLDSSSRSVYQRL
ncbi:MAG: metallophosphoesterase [Bdellovibrionales bacterium]|nr:metallophosphoesterase [Bdellovibrionales bacterium]